MVSNVINNGGGKEVMTYVYLHKRDGKVFYVGLGQNDRKNDRKSRNPFHLAVWDKALAEGTFSCDVVYEGDRPSCCDEEKRLIAYYPDLCNFTAGGDGGNTWVGDVEERRQSVRHKMNELWSDPTYRENHSRGMKSPKVSEGQRRRFSDPEKCKEHSLATQKSHFSEEDRKTLWGTKNKGRAWFHNPQTDEEWLGKGEPPTGFVRGRSKNKWKGVGGRVSK